MWTIEDALLVVRSLMSIGKEHGFYVALYGGVLATGKSSEDGDLDLVFMAIEDRTTLPTPKPVSKPSQRNMGLLPPSSLHCVQHTSTSRKGNESTHSSWTTCHCANRSKARRPPHGEKMLAPQSMRSKSRNYNFLKDLDHGVVPRLPVSPSTRPLKITKNRRNVPNYGGTLLW